MEISHGPENHKKYSNHLISCVRLKSKVVPPYLSADNINSACGQKMLWFHANFCYCVYTILR